MLNVLGAVGNLFFIAPNGLQISEGTNSVGIVRWNLGFCLCAVMPSFFFINQLLTNKK